jgi:hypothetical protein
MTTAMPLKIRLLGSLCALLLLAPGCDVDQPEQPQPPAARLGAIGTQYLDYLKLVDDVNRFHCDCRAKAGDFDSAEECYAFIGGPTVPPLMANCYAEVLDKFDQAREHLQCHTGRFRSMLGCMKAAGCSVEPDACMQEAACPPRPYEVESAIAERCLGYSLPKPFVCRDGTQVLPWLECDFSPDCPDGSDERANCPGAFACKGGRIISQQWVCDGFNDCDQADDEANCP